MTLHNKNIGITIDFNTYNLLTDIIRNIYHSETKIIYTL